ncbi:DUF3472 domain-containing protein [Paraflavitalea sp. CAU 1676]|uniref:DUF3472 domain-containing protein n=1 Tax=Paraflavitalea sp. CAU 1676 TaxID=3032598 RepID=UPI0023DA8CA4|nr:DUF3472 domain-containing protein [Paraflavitalea sp. CAU 1676]MDF2193427.1 DUF3472 domain-containing protein [Paraflavitalea sp. CAU 1676]
MKQILVIPALLTTTALMASPLPADVPPPFSAAASATIQVPLGGNTWAFGGAERRQVSGNGIERWKNKEVYFITYVRINTPGSMVVKLKASNAQASQLTMTIAGKKKKVPVGAGVDQWAAAGEWQVKDTGYIAIRLEGESRTGDEFPAISDYEISGTAINTATAYVKNNEGNFFYWGRRGPSVHLNYPFADSTQAEWFYNEVTVPVGQDVIGSYYMANGFGEGYFGMQANSATERRILFSVWSPFSTDDPKSIPEDMRITMLKKGEGVHTGEFGNEGSGGQSYLRFPWKAGLTYRFLLRGVPDNNNHTTYTAYFYDPEQSKWMLIASFKRPKTNKHLTRFHSFLENFNPEQGHLERRVLFGNQWIRDVKGNWISLSKAGFTYDNTAAKGYRKDYAGGVEGDKFFLKNCGFFNQYTLYRTSFERTGGSHQPEVDLEKLP